jgi:Sulfotransferase domain
MSLETEIIIVSGLPRSGTSLLMQMLAAGGITVITDKLRTADADNPRGYYEFELVKKIKHDASWLPQVRGKAVKMISQLLYDLPGSESYRVILMERDLDEVLVSQEKMLERLGRTAAPRAQMKQSYTLHLERLNEWLRKQPNIAILDVNYNDLLAFPQQEAERVSFFLDGHPDATAMVRAVDPALYRNRKASA